MKILALALTLFLTPLAMAATPQPILTMFKRLDEGNPEVAVSRLNVESKYQNLRGAKSRLWPSLSLSGVARESEPSAFSDPTGTSTGISSPSSNLGSQGTSGLSNIGESSQSGWTGQASLSYLLFTGFAISENINRAENELESASISEKIQKDQTRSQFLQLLLEWQNLKKIEPILKKADKAFSKVKRHKKQRSSFLYTTDDNLLMDEKMASLDYNKVRVEEGLNLTRIALEKMIPGLQESELLALPLIGLEYPLPSSQTIEEKYRTQSRNHKMNALSVESSQGYEKASKWNRPWLPFVSWSASYGQSGSFDGETIDNGASTSILLNFNLFDGFYTQARLQQSRITVKATQAKMQIEKDKRVLYLLHSRMKANIAKAEFAVKNSSANKKKSQWKDVLRKKSQGIATGLEVNASSLEYSQSQLEAFDSLKQYQQALLDIAVELNEWEKVQIHEINR